MYVFKSWPGHKRLQMVYEKAGVGMVYASTIMPFTFQSYKKYRLKQRPIPLAMVQIQLDI